MCIRVSPVPLSRPNTERRKKQTPWVINNAFSILISLTLKRVSGFAVWGTDLLAASHNLLHISVS